MGDPTYKRVHWDDVSHYDGGLRQTSSLVKSMKRISEGVLERETEEYVALKHPTSFHFDDDKEQFVLDHQGTKHTFLIIPRESITLMEEMKQKIWEKITRSFFKKKR